MKLFVTDLDKTFLQSDLTITQESIATWNKMVRSGYLMSVATARSLKKSLEFLAGLQLEIPMIFLDGAMVATSKGEIIHLAAIEKELAKEIIAVAKKECGIEPFVVGLEDSTATERFLYPKQLNEFQQQLIAAYKNDNRLRATSTIEPLEKNLKIVFMGKKDAMLQLEDVLKEAFGEKIEIKNAQDVYFDCYFLTVLHPLGDKAHALKHLLEYTQTTSSELCVFGDSHNDIAMFKKASKSVAVANAIEELKQHATVVLPHTNDQDGVAKFLQKNYLG